MTHGPMVEYFLALERLVANKPIRVEKGTKITNDSVSLEAGRSKGSIKKSRKVFAKLIEDIDKAAKEQCLPEQAKKSELTEAKELAKQYLDERDASLAREMCLWRELLSLREQIHAMTGERIVPLRVPGKRADSDDMKPSSS